MAPSQARKLPTSLLNTWKLQCSAQTDSECIQELNDWTVSSLAEAYVKEQLSRYEMKLQQKSPIISRASPGQIRAPSLSSVAIDGILAFLKKEDDFQKLQLIAKEIMNDLDSTAIQRFLNDPAVPYRFLRLFDDLPLPGHDQRRAVDVDEAVRCNERYFRSLDYKAREKQEFLVTGLEHLRQTIPKTRLVHDLLHIRRREPPKGSLLVLDESRRMDISLWASDVDYTTSFNDYTKDVFRGMDWRNVFIAGDVVLKILLQKERQIRNEDPFELFIYGLNAAEATKKVEHIHSVWVSNLQHSPQPKLVVKNASTITLYRESSDGRIQINLRLFSSCADVLLLFDHDACAIGFDGSKVMMLPRCARAIETGYILFRMDLVWGQNFEDRRQPRGERIFRYANRGFGLRFLPSYARWLELSHKAPEVNSLKDILSRGADDENISKREINDPGENFEPWNRYSFGHEPGLKTINRIAFLAQDYTQRYRHRVKALKVSGGMSNLSTILRHCEAWRLQEHGEANYFYDDYESTIYNRFTFDDAMQYAWNGTMEIDTLADNLERSNTDQWASVKRAVCQKLQIPEALGGFGNFSSRMLRQQVVGSDLTAVLRKQITIPVIVPTELEDFLINVLPQQYSDLPWAADTFRCLIPIHDPSGYDSSTATIPSLYDTAGERGNLRYWIISNESMWSNQHPALDLTADILWPLAEWLDRRSIANNTNQAPPSIDTDQSDCVWHLARHLRPRLIPDYSISEAIEAEMFRAWALGSPVDPPASSVGAEELKSAGAHPLSQDGRIPDELFWKEGDEGEWIGVGVPPWRDVDADAEKQEE